MNSFVKKWGLLAGIVLSLLMHLPHLGKDLMSAHVWRQTQTQSNIISFYEEDFNILNPRRNERGAGDGIFRMEFPLMQWLVAGVYKVAGPHLWLTRLFMYVVSAFAAWGMKRLLTAAFQHEWMGLIGAWGLLFSPSFFYFAINPLPDVFALMCSLWGVAFFLEWTHRPRAMTFFASGLLLALGTAVKLPFVLYFVVPAVWFGLELWRKGWNASTFFKGLLLGSFVALPAMWYMNVVNGWSGNGIVQGMLDNQESWRVIFYYLSSNLISTLPEMMLNYGALLFFLAGFYFLIRRKAWRHAQFPLFALWGLAVLAYFVFEINMIRSVHDYYLFPFYPLLFALVAYGCWHLLNGTAIVLRQLSLVLLASLPLFALIATGARWDPERPQFNKDLLIYQQELKQSVPDDALVVTGGDDSHFIYFYYLHKKGWGFDKKGLEPALLEQYRREGAQFLISDLSSVNENAAILAQCDSLLLTRGSFRVYRLRK